MKNVEEKLFFFAIGILLIFAFLLGLWVCNQHEKQNMEIRTDTITVVRIDTFVMERIVPKTITLSKTIIDTLFSTDTVLSEVYVPLNTYTFSDSLFLAQITGYKVTLDKIEIYNREKTQTITNTVTQTKRVPKRFGLGLSVGYSFTPRGFQPYVGIGLNYNVISF